jgi:protein-disulfide isomerase
MLTTKQFSPRHPNAARAMANWERKSQYLLREIVKFRTYIDTLTSAQVQKQKIYAEREALEQQEWKAEEGAATELLGAEVDGAKDASEATSSRPVTKQPSTSAFLLHP